MAGGSYFEVEARVVSPGVVAKIAALIEPPAKEIEKRLQEAIRRGLSGSGIGPGVQGTRTGTQYADAFSRAVKTRLEAAFRSLPDIKLKADSKDVDREIADIRKKLALAAKDIEVGINDKDALARIEALRLRLKVLSHDADIRVRFDARSALAQLEAIRRTTGDDNKRGNIFTRLLADAREASPVLDGIVGKLGSVGGAISSVGGSNLVGTLAIVSAIVAAISTIGPLTAAAAGGFLGVAGAAGVAALAVIGLKQQMADQTGFGQQISEQFNSIAREAKGLGQIAANAIGPAITDVLGLVRSVLPGFEGLIQLVGGRLGGAFRSVGTALVTLFQKAGPLIVDVAGYIEDGAAAFNRWIVSDSFSHFLAYARQQLPVILGFLKDFGSAIITTFVSLAPVGENVIKVFDLLFKGITKIGPVLRYVIDTLAPFVGLIDLVGSFFGGSKKKADATTAANTDLLKSFTDLQTGAGRLADTTAPLDTWSKITGDLSPKLIAAAGNTGQLAAAVAGIDARLRSATPALQTFMDTAANYSADGAKAADTAKLLGDALTASRGNVLDYTAGMLAADTATQGVGKAIHDNLKSVSDSGKLLGQSYLDASGKFVEGNSKFTAGSADVASALQGQVKAATDAATATYTNELATRGQATAAADALTVYKGYRQELIDQAVQAGKSKDAAKALADQYFAIPPDVDTFVKLLGQNDVGLAIQGLTDALNRLSDLIGKPQVALDSTAFDNSLAVKTSDLDYFGHLKPIPSLDLSTGAFDGSAAAANGVLDVLDRRMVGPTVNLNDFASYKLKGIAGLLLGLHDKTIYVNTVTGGHTAPGSARGNIFNSVKAYAGGGIESHQPQISKAVTPFRIWAEPETGGEAYIPLANDSRRTRAESILTNVANRFGMQVLPGDIARAAAASSGGSGGPTALVGTLTLDAGSIGQLSGTISGVAQGAIARRESDVALQSSGGRSSRIA